MIKWQTVSSSSFQTQQIGQLFGDMLVGGPVIVLEADLGGGKTTFVKGLAAGLGCRDVVSSPTFTISRVYNCRDGLQLHHFDFYRLDEPGLIADQLREALSDDKAVVAIEWSKIVKDILPGNALHIEIKLVRGDAESRELTFRYGDQWLPIIEKLRTAMSGVKL